MLDGSWEPSFANEIDGQLSALKRVVSLLNESICQTIPAWDGALSLNCCTLGLYRPVGCEPVAEEIGSWRTKPIPYEN